ncbi:MAG TPA: hypothetical protein VFN67_07285 [Polyangiales bacterium]|nr:hypothetical protein [Polyangiales bacterium]
MTTPEYTENNFEGAETKTRPIVTPRPDEDTSYIQHDVKSEVNARWQEVQTEFVDDPRKSVAHAHQLVSEAVQRIVDTFTDERNQLERQWSEGEDVSTEDLRVCLQRYREFFTRLLPLENARS